MDDHRLNDSKKMSRIEDKIDKISDKIHSIDVTLAAQHESLKIHIKRTDLLEKKADKLEMVVSRTDGALKLVVAIAITVAIRYLGKFF